MSLNLVDSEYGKSVLASGLFSRGQIVLKFSGDVIHKSNLPKIERIEDDRYLQIDRELYLGPSGDLDDYINHSCNPNCGLIFVDGKVFLTAIKKISLGEEITFDYSTTMSEDDWEMSCLCGSPQCRGRIRDFKHLPKLLQDYYVFLGVVPSYLLS
jgi:hypothetical protein